MTEASDNQPLSSDFDRLCRRSLIRTVGYGITVPYFRWLNTIEVKNQALLLELPRKNVIFLSNHQTYFTEAIALYDLVYIKMGLPLEDPFIRFSAATETMKKNLVTQILTMAGGVTFRRSFREGGVDIKRPVDLEGVSKVEQAIKEGWLLHFPTGTTKKDAPIRPGIAQLLHRAQAIAVPLHISGFRDLLLKGQVPGRVFKKATMEFLPPLDLSSFYAEPFSKEEGRKLVEVLSDLILEKP
jgi:1-acyl-sn-glycerol-3-phosphate acyltransferase